LVGRFTQGPMILAIAGALLFGFGFWRRRMPYDRATYVFLHLGLVVLAFSAPREAGQFFLRWSQDSTKASYRWTGGESCRGKDGRGEAVRSLKQLRPPYIIGVSGLRGDLGRALARRLGYSDRAPRANLAHLELNGTLNFGSASCFFPLFHSDAVKGELQLQSAFVDGEGKARCNASHSLSLQVDASLVGVASCRDLRSHVAAHLAREVRAQARRMTGHGR
ncbi:MAG: hypothetical protein JRH20_03640, partial [Deltaproteobacteria bacterium]|nr:hypothetical protein [Deltaproteobacteria bacterium]